MWKFQIFQPYHPCGRVTWSRKFLSENVYLRGVFNSLKKMNVPGCPISGVLEALGREFETPSTCAEQCRNGHFVIELSSIDSSYRSDERSKPYTGTILQRVSNVCSFAVVHTTYPVSAKQQITRISSRHATWNHENHCDRMPQPVCHPCRRAKKYTYELLYVRISKYPFPGRWLHFFSMSNV